MTFRKYSQISVFILLVLTLAGCGGSTSGGDDDGDSESGDGENPNGNTATQIDLIASSTSLPSAAIQSENGVDLTALLRDANNNSVVEPDVAFSSDAGRLETESAGTESATAVLFNDPDHANRTITVQAEADGIRDEIRVDVTGTELTLEGPDAIARGESATFTTRLSDSSGDPITAATIDVDTDPTAQVSASTMDTNSAGEATFTVSEQEAGRNTIRVSSRGAEIEKQITVGGKGLSFSQADEEDDSPTVGDTEQITVVYSGNNGPIADSDITFTASRGTLGHDVVTTDSQGEATTQIQSNVAGATNVTASVDGKRASRIIRFMAAEPATLVLNAASATITGNSTTNLTATARDGFSNPVANETINFRLGEDSAGTLSSSQTRTDTSGTARVVYTAPPSSVSEPVEIVSSVATDETLEDSTTITVAGEALSIRLGTGGPAELASDGTTYDAPYAALISDAAGNPVSDATLRLNVRAIAYRANDSPDTGCRTEDENNNGVLDPREDRNDNETLDPGQVVTVPSSPELDGSGVARFDITYLSRFAERVKVRLTATADSAGSEGDESLEFDLEGSPSGDNPFEYDCAVDR
ncbi:Ig-like domain-containing protein [Salinisphaera orenii]|uniref:Ig-like domain-containing protein n=1 Tax=Salinisphaera orenii TaxID=856731 RepID=UPI0011CEB10E|nr:Ig-like domain-containing protein [Salinisphaera halophila]